MARETSQDWEKIGAEEPWYGVLSAPEFLKANLTEEGKNAFYNQGADEMGVVVDLLRRFGPFNPGVGVDFGCGLGRLLFPMSRLCRHAYGLDVSPGMRDEAERQAALRGIDNVTILPDLPDGLKVDWINSYIVFQHILPRTGYLLLRDLLSRLNVGGHISIQITFSHDRRGMADLDRDLQSWRFDGETLTVLETAERHTGAMSMFDYDFNRVLKLVASNGIGDLHLRHTDHGGSQGWWIFGRKDV